MIAEGFSAAILSTSQRRTLGLVAFVSLGFVKRMSPYATTTVRWPRAEKVASSSATVSRNTILIVAMTSWLADLVYTGGVFESGLAMIADDRGVIAGFSRDEEHLRNTRRLP